MRNKYSDNEYGIYLIFNADTNCDYFGPHFNHFSGNCVEGTYEKCLEYARNNVRGFKGWREGYLQKIDVQVLV